MHAAQAPALTLPQNHGFFQHLVQRLFALCMRTMRNLEKFSSLRLGNLCEMPFLNACISHDQAAKASVRPWFLRCFFISLEFKSSRKDEFLLFGPFFEGKKNIFSFTHKKLLAVFFD